MDFLDFQIRGWLADKSHVQALVHSSPVGGMRKPVMIPIRNDLLVRTRNTYQNSYACEEGKKGDLIKLGQRLAQLLLSPPVFSMLIRSLEHVNSSDGLRIRLCLDAPLIDLPWEYLYRPDARDASSLEGFLILDPRISLVREAPNLSFRLKPSPKPQRLVFIGTFGPEGDDPYEVEKEYDLLTEALAGLRDLVTIDYRKASPDYIDKALTKQSAIFHYAGHINFFDGCGYLAGDWSTDKNKWLSCFLLANYFIRSGTRLGVFNACCSGRWEFMEPLIRSGLQAAIGIQGLISNAAAIAFCKKLYSALSIGLSLDESVTWARLHLLEPGVLTKDESLAWGTFMVYMPATNAVIFPRPQSKEIRNRQTDIRRQRQQTIINVYQSIGTVQGGQVVGVSGRIQPT